MGLTLDILIFSHVPAPLVGIATGEAIDWAAVRRNPTGYRYALAVVLLLSFVAAAIVILRGGAR